MQNLQPNERFVIGYVKDIEGLPVMNICVEPTTKLKTQNLGYTNHNGKFSIAVPNIENLSLTFHSKFNKLPYNGVSDIDDYEAKTVYIGNDSVVYVTLEKTAERTHWDMQIDETLCKANYIEGYVRDNDGNIQTPLVWVEDLPFVPRGTPFFTYCNEEGYFCIAVPDKETVSITFKVAGFDDKTITAEKNNSNLIEVVLEKQTNTGI